MNKKIFFIREKIINLIREFFTASSFHEVETPLMVKSPDTTPYNEVFETEFIRRSEIGDRRSEKVTAYFTPSPEFFMKKLLAQGFGNIFQICKAFRNQWEENSVVHNPEFTIMEWYRTNADYTDIMEDCENLVNYIYQNLYDKTKNSPLRPAPEGAGASEGQAKLKILNYQRKEINIARPWIRLSVREAFKRYAYINLDEFLDFKVAKKIALGKGYKIAKNTTWEQIYHQIFLNEIEPRFNQLFKPLFLYDYPASLAALSRKKKADPRYAERFELYIAGIELGNAFSELTDYKEQEKRLQNDILERKRLKMKVFDYDHDFIDHLKKGLPETGGIAIGIDRLIMLFTNSKSVEEVLFFPFKKIFSKYLI